MLSGIGGQNHGWLVVGLEKELPMELSIGLPSVKLAVGLIIKLPMDLPLYLPMGFPVNRLEEGHRIPQ